MRAIGLALPAAEQERVVISSSPAAGTSSRRFHPLLESAAVVLVAVAGWYLFQPLMSRLLPSGLATDDRSTKAVVGGAIVDVAPRSTLAVRSNDPRAPSVFIERGQATFDVVPGNHLVAPFEVYSGDLLVTATDARFTVVCWSDASTITVERGVVEVEANGNAFSLVAGARWPTTADARLPSPVN